MEYDKQTMAMAHGKQLPISAKQSVVVCAYVKGKDLQKVKKMLARVMQLKQAIPFSRYNKGAGHRPGLGPAQYPIKTAKHLLMLLESAESNAQQKGLDVNKLVISHIKSDNAGTSWRYGRQRRRRAKRTHIEVILTESKKVAKETEKKKEPKATEAKGTQK